MAKLIVARFQRNYLTKSKKEGGGVKKGMVGRGLRVWV